MAQSTAKLPFSPPAWLTPRRVGIGSLCLGMIALNLSLHPGVFARGGWDIGFFSFLSLFLALSPLAWHAWLTRISARSSEGASGFASGLSLMLFIGAMAGLFFLLLWQGGVWFDFWAKLLSQSSWASLYGLGVAAIYVALLALVGRAEEDPSHDALDSVLIGAGLWLYLLGGAIVHLTNGGPLLIGLVLLALGVCCVLWPLWRFGALLRWIDKVSDGEDPRWQIVSRERVRVGSAPLLPLFFEEEDSSYEKILVYRDSSRMGPYRGVDEQIPVALLPGRFGRVLGVSRKRARGAILALVGQIVLFGVLLLQALSASGGGWAVTWTNF